MVWRILQLAKKLLEKNFKKMIKQQHVHMLSFHLQTFSNCLHHLLDYLNEYLIESKGYVLHTLPVLIDLSKQSV